MCPEIRPKLFSKVEVYGLRQSAKNWSNSWENLEEHFQKLVVAMDELDPDRLVTLLETSKDEVLTNHAICNIGCIPENDIVERTAGDLVDSVDDELCEICELRPYTGENQWSILICDECSPAPPSKEGYE